MSHVYTIYFYENFSYTTLAESFRDARDLTVYHDTGAFDGLNIKCVRKHVA